MLPILMQSMFSAWLVKYIILTYLQLQLVKSYPWTSMKANQESLYYNNFNCHISKTFFYYYVRKG